MRCLYCGKDYWLPAQIRDDPDFCSGAHREKYNNLVERAMRCIQGEAPLPASAAMPAPVMAAPVAGRGAADPADSGGRAAAAAGLDKAPIRVNSALSHLRFREKPHIPQLAARPVFDRLKEGDPEAPNPAEKTAAQNSPEPKGMSAGPTFSLLDTNDPARRKAGRLVLIAVAACLAVGGVLWIGASAVRLGKKLLSPSVQETAARKPAAPEIVPPPEPASGPRPASDEDSIGWFRKAAIPYAAARVSDSFDRGMAAWDVASRGWAPGWSHSPDGYVRPGQLALLQPTLGYGDYRMEFFGEIENKSLSWVVRGKDRRNYYAMQLTLTRGGLRPLLSLEHYPVVNGKAGHTVAVPLSVMIHNGVPYHVAVQLQGSSYRVWIEGEPVDSWSDDTLPAGGVGFFAEPGARARIYWLTVSKNDNWFGWLCARIAGTGGQAASVKKS